MDQLEGNPELLQLKVDEYARASRDLLAAVEQLAVISTTGTSLAVTALESAMDDTKDRLSNAQERYGNSTGALRTYRVALSSAHSTVDGAIESADSALSREETASNQATAYDRAADDLEAQGVAQSLVDERRELAQAARNRANAAMEDYQDALATRSTAVGELESAAQTAIDVLILGFDGSSDGNMDRLGNLGDWIADKWDAFVAWIEQILTDIINTLRDAVALILAVVSYIVLVLAIIQIVGLLVAMLLANPLLFAQMVIDILNGGDITPYLNMLMPALLSLTAFQAYIQLRILTDVIAPDPEVTRFEPTVGGPYDAHQLQASEYLSSTTPGSIDEIVARMSAVDQAGGAGLGDEIGVIDITSVIGPDGQEQWIITLPSTQDWGLPKDTGATNDLDGNLALFLGSPALRTQYERALTQAMESAGVRPSDPIVFAGFSQGGIMAAHMASHRSDTYTNIQGVIAAGSPIDSFPIPSHTKVVSIQHYSDPVHQLDGIYDGGDSSTRMTVWGGEQHSLAEAHNSAFYEQTMAGADQLGAANDMFASFLTGDQYGESASVQYQWNE